MKRFKNILFFADGPEEMSPALQRAVQLAEETSGSRYTGAFYR
jgi:hypothetical protein